MRHKTVAHAKRYAERSGKPPLVTGGGGGGSRGGGGMVWYLPYGLGGCRLPPATPSRSPCIGAGSFLHTIGTRAVEFRDGGGGGALCCAVL